MVGFFTQFSNLAEFIKWGGLLVLFLIIFAECGLFFGFIFPGDSLLFTAGLLAAAGNFNIFILILVLWIAAVLGDQTGYWTGRYFGRKLFEKKDSKFFKKKHLLQAEEFYARNGVKTIVIARFIPVIRTFVPVTAGIAKMEYHKYLSFDIVGGLTWVVVMTGAGYYLVRFIPSIATYLNYVIIGIIVVSFIPVLLQYRKERMQKTA